MVTGALILGAGSTAQPHHREPLCETGPATAAQRLARTFRAGGVELLALVARPPLTSLQKQLGRLGVVCLEQPDGQMLDSAKTGLAYLQGRCDQVLLTPAYLSGISPHTVELLAGCGATAASPVFHGKRGHPLLLSSQMIPLILGYQGEDGLRGALRASGHRRELIPVEDSGILLDRTAGEDQTSPEPTGGSFYPESKLRLTGTQPFFGPGSAWLLSLIDLTGSVRLACQQMGVSYSKGWKMLSAMEEELGYTVVQRQQGGLHGGTAALTAKGRALLTAYTGYERECKAAIKEIFHRHFG